MSAIQRELDRIAVELRRAPSPERYGQLYAAQQALAWVQAQDVIMPPYDAIMGGKVWQVSLPQRDRRRSEAV